MITVRDLVTARRASELVPSESAADARGSPVGQHDDRRGRGPGGSCGAVNARGTHGGGAGPKGNPEPEPSAAGSREHRPPRGFARAAAPARDRASAMLPRPRYGETSERRRARSEAVVHRSAGARNSATPRQVSSPSIAA